VESTGEIEEAGIVTADDKHAVALAAVTSTVKNTEAPDGEIRVYRMKVTLDVVDDKWLVSDVEFVA
jgi:Mce-associated membrane protein